MRAEHSKLWEIAKIAIPSIFENLILVIIVSIDTKMISVLGKGAISAVAFTVQPRLLFLAIFVALGIATSIFISQAVGKKDSQEATTYFHSILRTTILLSIAAGLILSAAARPIMFICNRQPETLDMSVTFFRIVMGCVVSQTVSIVLNAALRSIGKAHISFISSIAMGIIDIVVNYLFIEGNLGCPRLEVAGDALGTVAGSCAACIVSIFAIRKYSDFLSFDGFFTHKFKSSPEIRDNIRSKAGNVVLENVFTQIGFLLSGIIVSTLSTDETSVYSVAMILMGYSLAHGDGLQSAAVALCGRSMGAKKTEDLKEYGRLCSWAGIGISTVLSIVYVASAQWYYQQYFSDATDIAHGIFYTYFVAALTIIQIYRIVKIGVIRGTGETKKPRDIATVCVLILNPGIGFLLTCVFHCGIMGIWAASVISQIAWLIASIYMNRTTLKKLPDERRA